MHKIQEQLLKLSETMDLGKLSYRDIGKEIGIENSPQKVKHHLLQLEKNGFIKINRTHKIIEGIQINIGKMSELSLCLNRPLTMLQFLFIKTTLINIWLMEGWFKL